MQVTSVVANTVIVPMGATLIYPNHAMQSREFTLVKVRGSNGAEGFGFCCSGTRVGHLSTIAVRDLLRTHVIGKDPQQVEEIWNAMFRDSVLHGRRGSVMRAISAIDIALWDLRAKDANVSLCYLLGTNRNDRVPAYASGGVYMDGKTVADLAKEVAGYAELGYRAVKIKVGGLSLKEDVVRVKACREAIGCEVQLLLDANNAWSDAHTAIRAVRQFEPYDPGWIEEPVMPDEMEASAAVAAAVSVPVATGELEATRWGFQQLIHYKAASILQPDAAVCGGITEWRKIAALAAAHSMPVAPHWFPEIHMHLVAATPNAIWVECVPDTRVSSFALILKSPVEVQNGDAVLPTGPGLGIELEEKAVAKYSVDGWH